MTVRYNVSVRSFPFWGDAFNTRCVLSDEQCDMVEMYFATSTATR